MPSTTPCVPCCSTPQTVNIPGPSGGTGASGTNSFTVTTSGFTTPALAANVTITVANSTWAVVGQPVAISNGTATADIYSVAAVPSTTQLTLTYLNYTTNVGTGNVIAAGNTVGPAGFSIPVTPISIANGGTGSSTKANAQTALGLGRDALVNTSTGLSQAVTASFVQVGTCAVTVTSTGTYLITGSAVLDWNGVTFAASRTVTVKLRNTTQGIDISSNTYQTQSPTTTSYPSTEVRVPWSLYSAAVANDIIQILITVSVINSAGTFQATSANITAIPLRLN